jgi:hypothetical protein
MIICGLGRLLMNIFYKNNFETFDFMAPILMLIFPFIDSMFFYSIQKFMKNKYYSPFFILFLVGCIHSLISIILLVSFYRPDVEIKQDFSDLLTTGIKIDKLYILLLFIFSILFAFEFFAKVITINSFTIFHYILLVNLGELISSIFDLISNFDILYMINILITFPIEIFECLVFIEIIELNFCGLNLNLKKSIIRRSVIEVNTIYNIDEEENEEEDNLNEIISTELEDNNSGTDSVY